jgi:hypothetical protein
MTNIIFTPVFAVPDDYSPQPAAKHVPDWYKSLESYVGGMKVPPVENAGGTSATIKRCMPVFDAITSGYIIPTYVDVFVTQRPAPPNPNNVDTQNTVPYYQWPSKDPIQFHPVQQAPNHPARKGLPDEVGYPKWSNPWGIKTPPGYSCLFVQPFHRDSIFTILPGIVDTDSYSSPVNFPFTLNDWKFEGLIPAGTPMVQVIPFKRDVWKMSIGSEKELKEQNDINLTLKSRFFDVYKNSFRYPREFK